MPKDTLKRKGVNATYGFIIQFLKALSGPAHTLSHLNIKLLLSSILFIMETLVSFVFKTIDAFFSKNMGWIMAITNKTKSYVTKDIKPQKVNEFDALANNISLNNKAATLCAGFGMFTAILSLVNEKQGWDSLTHLVQGPNDSLSYLIHGVAAASIIGCHIASISSFIAAYKCVKSVNTFSQQLAQHAKAATPQ